MYEAFDNFLARSTWFTREAPDRDRFFCVLRKVVNHPSFNPDSMGDHFDNSPARRRLTEDFYVRARDHYVAAAWAVKRYLKVHCDE